MGNLIGGELELVSIGIVEVDGMRDPVVLELYRDAQPREFSLRPLKIGTTHPECHMAHGERVALGWRLGICAFYREERERGGAHPHNRGKAAPHVLVEPGQTENLGVLADGALDVSHRQGHMVDPFDPEHGTRLTRAMGEQA
jgi:hypothetical protein